MINTTYSKNEISKVFFHKIDFSYISYIVGSTIKTQKKMKCFFNKYYMAKQSN